MNWKYYGEMFIRYPSRTAPPPLQMHFYELAAVVTMQTIAFYLSHIR